MIIDLGTMRLDTETLDLAAEWFFTAGQCWALAHALHEATGWPVVLEGCSIANDWDHALVADPEGVLVDVRGLWDAEEYADHEAAWLSVEEQARQCWGPELGPFEVYFKVCMDVARAFLPAVLKRYEAARWDLYELDVAGF